MSSSFIFILVILERATATSGNASTAFSVRVRVENRRWLRSWCPTDVQKFRTNFPREHIATVEAKFPHTALVTTLADLPAVKEQGPSRGNGSALMPVVVSVSIARPADIEEQPLFNTIQPVIAYVLHFSVRSCRSAPFGKWKNWKRTFHPTLLILCLQKKNCYKFKLCTM